MGHLTPQLEKHYWVAPQLIKANSIAQVSCGATGRVGDEEAKPEQKWRMVLARKQCKEDKRQQLELAGENIGGGKQEEGQEKAAAGKLGCKSCQQLPYQFDFLHRSGQRLCQSFLHLVLLTAASVQWLGRHSFLTSKHPVIRIHHMNVAIKNMHHISSIILSGIGFQSWILLLLL